MVKLGSPCGQVKFSPKKTRWICKHRKSCPMLW